MPLLGNVATKNHVALLSHPVLLLFASQPLSRPSQFFLQTKLFRTSTWSIGFFYNKMFAVQVKLNNIGPQVSSELFFILFANFTRNAKSFLVTNPLRLAWQYLWPSLT